MLLDDLIAVFYWFGISYRYLTAVYGRCGWKAAVPELTQLCTRLYTWLFVL